MVAHNFGLARLPGGFGFQTDGNSVLLGIGVTTRQVQWPPVLGVLASWVVTLPCAALLAALAFWGVRPGR